jgi:uncharacterized protein (UPF0248 family)
VITYGIENSGVREVSPQYVCVITYGIENSGVREVSPQYVCVITYGIENSGVREVSPQYVCVITHGIENSGVREVSPQYVCVITDGIENSGVREVSPQYVCVITHGIENSGVREVSPQYVCVITHGIENSGVREVIFVCFIFAIFVFYQDFSQFVFGWYIREQKQGKLLKQFRGIDRSGAQQHALSQFLVDHPSLSWLQNVFSGDYKQASSTLMCLAKEESELLQRKKVQ